MLASYGFSCRLCLVLDSPDETTSSTTSKVTVLLKDSCYLGPFRMNGGTILSAPIGIEFQVLKTLNG